MPRKLAFFFPLVLAGMMLMNLHCSGGSSKDQLVYLNHHDTVKYVGKEACKPCHLAIYNTFVETGMGRSFGPATRMRSTADFTNNKPVYDPARDFWYMPRWTGDSLFIVEFRLKGRDTVFSRSEKVDYIVGSGQHTHSHLRNINGFVAQLPLTWYAQKGKWDLPPGFEKGRNQRFDRVIDMECMSCHNAMPTTEAGTVNRFVSIPDGIDCERCHGPGELHVKEKLAGHLVDTSKLIDFTIVNPRKLSWERQIDVCQRCHLQGNAVLKPGKSFKDFRPGMILSDMVEVFMPRYNGDDNAFIMASHAQRLQKSKCFAVSNGKSNQQSGREFSTLQLTCITCHNPHVSVRKTGKEVFNNACKQCHTKNTCKEENTIRLKNGDDCAGCHMPRSGSVDIPHVTVHDHKIGIPAKNEKLKTSTNTFAGLYSVNSRQPDKIANVKAWLQYAERFEGGNKALDSADLFLKGISNEDLLDARVHLCYLKENWSALLGVVSGADLSTIRDPWTLYRIGQAYQNTGDAATALSVFDRVVKQSPNQPEFMHKRAVALIQLSRFEEAAQQLAQVIALRPDKEDAYVDRGFALLNLNQAQEAMQSYNQALKLDPDHGQALINRAALFHLQGNKARALQDLNHLLKVQPGRAEVKELIRRIQAG